MFNYDINLDIKKKHKNKFCKILLESGYNVYYGESNTISITVPESDVQKIEYTKEVVKQLKN